jgi:hypothetical protein
MVLLRYPAPQITPVAPGNLSLRDKLRVTAVVLIDANLGFGRLVIVKARSRPHYLTQRAWPDYLVTDLTIHRIVIDGCGVVGGA